MLCMVGWFMCKRLFGPLSIHAVLVCMSYLPIYWSCPLALPLGLPCLRGLPLWVWLGWFGSLPPWFLFAVLVGPSLGCLRLWCGLGALASRCHGVVCSRWAFALGVDGVLPLWAAAAAVDAPSLCAVYLGAVQIKVHTFYTFAKVFCHSAIASAEQDHEIMVQSMVNEQERIRQAFADLFRLMDKAGWISFSSIVCGIYRICPIHLCHPQFTHLPVWSHFEVLKNHTPHRQYPTNYVCVRFSPTIFIGVVFSPNVPQKCKL